MPRNWKLENWKLDFPKFTEKIRPAPRVIGKIRGRAGSPRIYAANWEFTKLRSR